MKTIQIFDRPLCCATGVCGPQVDPVLPRFAADLDWLKSQGLSVERYNLAQQPDMFINNATVQQLLTTRGTDCLPIVLVDGNVVKMSDYPTRENFAEWTGLVVRSSGIPAISILSDRSDCSQPGCC